MTLRTIDWNPAAATHITEPGVYDIPNDTYHRDPIKDGSLSASGARKLLPPHCPAIYRHERDHGRPPKRDFEFGHAAHQMVLGVGAEIVLIEADDYKTKAAREARDEARADGKTPLLEAEYTVVTAMAKALREHPIAAALLDPDRGTPEQSLFWTDPETGVWRRARLDWLPEPGSGRLIVGDYKTAISAAPEKIERALDDYGYARQAAWYLDGVHALGLAERAAFVLIVQEKTAPYLVTVAEPDALSLEAGRFYNRQALHIFAQCQKSGRWPGYSDDIAYISLPPWAQNRYFQESGQ